MVLKNTETLNASLHAILERFPTMLTNHVDLFFKYASVLSTRIRSTLEKSPSKRADLETTMSSVPFLEFFRVTDFVLYSKLLRDVNALNWNDAFSPQGDRNFKTMPEQFSEPQVMLKKIQAKILAVPLPVYNYIGPQTTIKALVNDGPLPLVVEPESVFSYSSDIASNTNGIVLRETDAIGFDPIFGFVNARMSVSLYHLYEAIFYAALKAIPQEAFDSASSFSKLDGFVAFGSLLETKFSLLGADDVRAKENLYYETVRSELQYIFQKTSDSALYTYTAFMGRFIGGQQSLLDIIGKEYMKKFSQIMDDENVVADASSLSGSDKFKTDAEYQHKKYMVLNFSKFVSIIMTLLKKGYRSEEQTFEHNAKSFLDAAITLSYATFNFEKTIIDGRMVSIKKLFEVAVKRVVDYDVLTAIRGISANIRDVTLCSSNEQLCALVTYNENREYFTELFLNMAQFALFMTFYGQTGDAADEKELLAFYKSTTNYKGVVHKLARTLREELNTMVRVGRAYSADQAYGDMVLQSYERIKGMANYFDTKWYYDTVKSYHDRVHTIFRSKGSISDDSENQLDKAAVEFARHMPPFDYARLTDLDHVGSWFSPEDQKAEELVIQNIAGNSVFNWAATRSKTNTRVAGLSFESVEETTSNLKESSENDMGGGYSIFSDMTDSVQVLDTQAQEVYSSLDFNDESNKKFYEKQRKAIKRIYGKLYDFTTKLM